MYVFIHIFVRGFGRGVCVCFPHLVIQYAKLATCSYDMVHLHFFLLPEGTPPSPTSPHTHTQKKKSRREDADPYTPEQLCLGIAAPCITNKIFIYYRVNFRKAEVIPKKPKNYQFVNTCQDLTLSFFWQLCLILL